VGEENSRGKKKPLPPLGRKRLPHFSFVVILNLFQDLVFIFSVIPDYDRESSIFKINVSRLEAAPAG
jgi:hypothetical protein